MRLFVAVMFLAACGEVAQTPVRYPAVARGAAGTFAAGDWQVTLSAATVAFGPAYFCATEAASMDLCPAAVNELAAVGSFDALDGDAQPLGTVEGVTGELRSVQYDFGINWFTRQNQPTPAEGVTHSAHFEGQAVSAAGGFRFVADIDLPPSHQGTQVVQGARVAAHVTSSDTRLSIAADPGRWWERVDFDELLQLGMDPVVVEPGMRAHNNVVLRMTTSAAPQFSWEAQ
jgi:hypothetical protein